MTGNITPDKESVHEEINDIQKYVDDIPVVKESLRKEPRLIAVAGQDIETFHEHMRERFDCEDEAVVNPKWNTENGKFIAHLHIEETQIERRHDVKFELTTRPINNEEMSNIERQLAESGMFGGQLPDEIRSDLEKFRIKQ